LEVVNGPTCLSTWDDQCPDEEPPSGFTSASTLYDLCPEQCGSIEQKPSECGEVCPDGYTNNFSMFGPHYCENAEFRGCAICDGVGGVEIDSCESVVHIEAHESHDKVPTVKSILNEGNSGKVHGLHMTIDFSNEDLIQCNERSCKFINLYLMIHQEGCDLTDSTDPAKSCEGQIYQSLNMMFFSGSSTNNEHNVLQSDRRITTKYNLLFERETSLTREETFRMVTSNIQYGEEPKRNTKQFVKVSFVLPKRQGKVEVSISAAVLSYTLGTLWTTVIATFSVVSQIFFFFFPNILHKSYFRFQKWKPNVDDRNVKEDDVKEEDVKEQDVKEEAKKPQEGGADSIEMMVVPEKITPENRYGASSKV